MKPSIAESDVTMIGLSLRRLLVLMERLDGWHFDRLDHDYNASGLWSARAVWEPASTKGGNLVGAKRESVRGYGAWPHTALEALRTKLADRYQVPS